LSQIVAGLAEDPELAAVPALEGKQVRLLLGFPVKGCLKQLPCESLNRALRFAPAVQERECLMSSSPRRVFWSRRHPWLWIALWAVVALSVVLAVRPFTGVGKPGSIADAANARDAAAAVQASPSPSGAGASTPSPSPSPLQPTSPPSVATWEAGPGGTALGSVSQQLGNVAMAHGVGQFVEMKMACAKLASAVTTAKAGPAIPDAAMQLGYLGALGMFTTAAADCQAAISFKPDGDEYVQTQENTTMLSQATSALTTGSKDLYMATYHIRRP